MRPAGTGKRLVVGIDLVMGEIERNTEIPELAFIKPVGAAHAPIGRVGKGLAFPSGPEIRPVGNLHIAVRRALPAAVTGNFKFARYCGREGNAAAEQGANK
ncbi:hypothetical protein D3C72_1660770 [compost metagenome]